MTAPPPTPPPAKPWVWLQHALTDDVKLPLLLVGLLSVALSLYFLREILIPFTIAVLLSYLLRPGVQILTACLEYLGTCCQAPCCVSCWSRVWGWCTRCRGTPLCCGPPTSARRDAGGGTDVDGACQDEAHTDETSALLGEERGLPVLVRVGGGGDQVGLAVVGSDLAEGEEEDVTAFYFVRGSRLLAVLLATALAVGLLAILVLVVADSVQSFQEQYWATFSKQFDAVMQRLVDWLRRNLHMDASSLMTLADTLSKELSTASTLMGIANAVIVIIVTLLLTMFLLLDDRFDAKWPMPYGRPGDGHSDGSKQGAGVKGVAWAVGHAPAPSLRRVASARAMDAAMWRSIDQAIHRYIIAKTAVSALMGLVVYIVLGPCLRVKLAHLFGVLTFFLNYIPNLGAVIAAVIPLPIILLDPELQPWAQALAIILPVVIHFIIGNFVEPFVLSPLLSLHPVIVLLSLGVWYVIWGTAGAILAVPLTSVLTITLKRTQHPYALFLVDVLVAFRFPLHPLHHHQQRFQREGDGDDSAIHAHTGVDSPPSAADAPGSMQGVRYRGVVAGMGREGVDGRGHGLHSGSVATSTGVNLSATTTTSTAVGATHDMPRAGEAAAGTTGSSSSGGLRSG